MRGKTGKTEAHCDIDEGFSFFEAIQVCNYLISCIFSLISDLKTAVDVGGDVADVVLGVGIPVFQSDFDLSDGI